MKPYKLPTLQIVKKKKIERELFKLEQLKESILSKGDDFQIDKSFEVFDEFLKDFDRDQALKFIFSLKFNKDFQRLNQMGELEVRSNSSRSRRDRPYPRRRDKGDRKNRGERRAGGFNRKRRSSTKSTSGSRTK